MMSSEIDTNWLAQRIRLVR